MAKPLYTRFGILEEEGSVPYAPHYKGFSLSVN
jgi:hypothetical protein